MKRKLIFILSLILVFSITACTKDSTDSDKGDTLPIEENGTDEDNQNSEEQPNTDSDGSQEVSNEWPTDFMPAVPELEGNIVTSKEEGPNKYFIEFEDIDYDEALNYVNTLKESVFNQNTNDHQDANVINYKAMDKDNNLVVFHWSKDGITKLELIKKYN